MDLAESAGQCLPAPEGIAAGSVGSGSCLPTSVAAPTRRHRPATPWPRSMACWPRSASPTMSKSLCRPRRIRRPRLTSGTSSTSMTLIGHIGRISTTSTARRPPLAPPGDRFRLYLLAEAGLASTTAPFWDASDQTRCGGSGPVVLLHPRRSFHDHPTPTQEYRSQSIGIGANGSMGMPAQVLI